MHDFLKKLDKTMNVCWPSHNMICLFRQIKIVQHIMKLYVVQKCQCLYFSVFIVASFSVNDRLDATWHARNKRFNDFADPKVLDNDILFHVLSARSLFVCHLILRYAPQVLNRI